MKIVRKYGEICYILHERKDMEFPMETYLEEFIEGNFDKIGFDPKLELYEDEDHRGRQYPTRVVEILIC